MLGYYKAEMAQLKAQRVYFFGDYFKFIFVFTAQCSTTNLLDNDTVVMVNGSQQTLVNSRTTGQFSCRDPGQFTGPASAICTNGTFDYSDEPSCLGKFIRLGNISAIDMIISERLKLLSANQLKMF